MAKIVAQTATGYLIDMTPTEPAQLVGHWPPEREDSPTFNVGETISISEALAQVVFTAKRLRDIADFLDPTANPRRSKTRPNRRPG